MLHHESVAPETLGILKSLSQLPVFNGFNLVDGTSLALQIGHRISVDLDFFTPNEFDVEEVIVAVAGLGYSVETIGKKPNSLNLFVNDIKVDILKYSYPFVDDILQIEGINMMGKKDIAAMKISAITNRGEKKDFVDLFFLLKEIDFGEAMTLYSTKYKMDELLHVYKSLVYFDDADLQATPKMLIPIGWEEIKEFFISLIKRTI